MSWWNRRSAEPKPIATRPVESHEEPDNRWRSRPWMARVVRLSILAIPVIGAFLFALAATSALPDAEGVPLRLLRWLGIAAASTVMLLGLQSVARRFLPLAGLFSLTLIFPDTAPSRFGTALRRDTPKQLEARLAAVGERGLGDTPPEAAKELLELVAQLSKHDRMTRGHSERVRAYSRIIGEELGLSESELDRLQWAGMIHDVGKMYVPSDILNKPGSLTDEEFETIKSHALHGQRLVAGLAPWLGDSARAVWEHHERYGGGGYPTGVTGEHTALASRIVCVADAFDVMTSARSYKKPMSASLARAELERCAGSQFDPMVVRGMLSISLGTLWAAMGPLSLIAQIRLFPRRLTQASGAIAVTVASVLALVATSVAGGVPWSAAASEMPAAAASSSVPDALPPTAAPTSGPPDEPPVTDVTTAPTTSSTSTTTTTTTTSTTTTSSIPATTAAPTTTPIVPPPTAAPTTRPRATAPPTTQTPRATTRPTTASTTTTTTTTTTIPAAPDRLTLASSTAGPTASSAILDLANRPPVNSGPLPNYDTDRNPDAGLTIIRSATGVDNADPTRVQVWRVPAAVTTLDMPARLQLWVAPAAEPEPGFIVVEAALFDCNASRTNCTELARDISVIDPVTGRFNGVTFDLDAGRSSVAIGAGRRLELRVATLEGAADAVLAYDSSEYPSLINFG